MSCKNVIMCYVFVHFFKVACKFHMLASIPFGMLRYAAHFFPLAIDISLKHGNGHQMAFCIILPACPPKQRGSNAGDTGRKNMSTAVKPSVQFNSCHS